MPRTTRFPTSTTSATGATRAAGLDFEHSAYVMVIDKHGRTRVGFSYELLNTDLLLQDLQSLKSEA